MIRKCLVFFLVVCSVLVLSAEEKDAISTSMSLTSVVAYEPPFQKGYNTDFFAPVTFDVIEESEVAPGDGSPARSLGSSIGSPVAQISYDYTITVPMLTADGPLFEGNNTKFVFSTEFTPVAGKLKAKVVFTPIAVANIFAGGLTGTGWPFLGIAEGLSINEPNEDSITPQPFGGAVIKAYAGGTFQFDFGVIFPGDWTHVLLQLAPQIAYWKYTGADDSTAWQWNADGGENFNSFRYEGTYVLAYQMPLPVNLFGVMLEHTRNLFETAELSPVSENGWGSDFLFLTVSPLVNWELNDDMNLTLICQIKNGRKYSDSTIGYRYFKNREMTGTYWYLKRIVVMHAWSF